MGGNVKSDRLITRTSATRQSTPAWVISAFDIERAIETLPVGLKGDLTQIEVADELRASPTDYRECLAYPEDMEAGPYSERIAEGEKWIDRKERGRPPFSSGSQKGPLFPRRFAQQIEECLPENATLPQNTSGWIISAPQIERCIRRFYAKYHRAPIESEVEEEVSNGTFYREALTLLKDFEINLLHLEGKPGSDKEWTAYSPRGSEGDVLLSCVRSEMQGLFRDAISSLPKMERLAISLSYTRCRYEKGISLTLDLPDSTIAEGPIRGYLSVRALLPNPDLGEVRPKPRRILPELSGGSASEKARKNSRIRASDNWDVTVYGSRSGLLPVGLSGQWGDDQADWTQSFTSWYCFDSQHNLNRVRREEAYHLKLEI